MKKRVIIITLILLLIGIIGIKEIRKKENNILQEVKVKDSFPNKDKTLSIMIEQDGGNYTEGDIWPDPDVYEYEKADCTDGDGAAVPSEGVVNFEENNIHVKTKNTIYCTLYFRIMKGTPAETVILASNQLESESYVSSRGDTLRRYQGKVTNDGNGHITNDVNNYICFETSNKGICTGDTDKYLYRIIGIDTTNKEIKIMKREALAKAYSWGNDGETWADAELQKNLNGDLYLNNIDPNWSKLILSRNWKYGQVPTSSINYYTNGYSQDGQTLYGIEKSYWKNELKNTKIGLIYLSDYYLSGGNLTCLGDYYAECTKSWLFIDNNDSKILSTTNTAPPNRWDYTMVHGGASAWYINSGGYISVGGGYARAIRPVFYLSSNIEIIGGDGSLNDPYRIKKPTLT